MSQTSQTKSRSAAQILRRSKQRLSVNTRSENVFGNFKQVHTSTARSVFQCLPSARRVALVTFYVLTGTATIPKSTSRKSLNIDKEERSPL